jgi:hypothetical protein
MKTSLLDHPGNLGEEVPKNVSIPAVPVTPTLCESGQIHASVAGVASMSDPHLHWKWRKGPSLAVSTRLGLRFGNTERQPYQHLPLPLVRLGGRRGRGSRYPQATGALLSSRPRVVTGRTQGGNESDLSFPPIL